jgi:hypothetical protein
MIRLPAGADTRLPSVPGVATRDGAVIGASYTIVGGGLVATVTVEAVRPIMLASGFESARSTLRLDHVFLGRPTTGEVDVVAGPAFQTMEPGSRYLVFLVAGTEPPGTYNLAETHLYDSVDGSWVMRRDPGDPYVDKVPQLVLTDRDVEAIVEEARAYVAERQAAGRAVMVMAPGDEPNEVDVSGYARGETIGLKVCAWQKDFSPRSVQRCDADLGETITPDTDSFTVTFEPPAAIRVSPEESLDCKVERCVLVAYDTGWPDRVWAVYPST